MKRKLLLIRAHKTLAAGGPVPPLGLLYIASVVMRELGTNYELRILHTGLNNTSLEKIKEQMQEFKPHYIGISAMTCEFDLMLKIAGMSKAINKESIVIAGGPHATLAKETLLKEQDIDFSIIGEGEITIVELLKALEYKSDLSGVDGIVYKQGSSICSTRPRALIENLNDISISSAAWDLIDIREYAKYPNWNGTCKEKFYIPIITSRGCPFNCTFCSSRDTFGKNFRARSLENVSAEILSLYKKYRIKEIHFYDDVFNFDTGRAKRICLLIADSGINFSLAFPNGLRADIMTDDLLIDLKKAGTYKIHYGVETAVPRLQQAINKNLDLGRVKIVLNKTARTGILTAGYFMLGFPTETPEEVRQTIDFACSTNLDNAYFFKYTDFSDTPLYRDSVRISASQENNSGALGDLHFYSTQRSHAQISPLELNNLILKAQQRFYLNPKRIWRGIFRAPRKSRFLKNLLAILALVIQSYLVMKLTKVNPQGK